MAGTLSGLEVGRRVSGFVFEVGVKAYGAAAALSVALSDAETAGGKAKDAVAAVPNLMDRYRDAKYVVEHREEIQTSLDYMQQNAPDAEQLEATAAKSVDTLEGISQTWDETAAAWDAMSTWRIWRGIPDSFGHLRAAWDAKPDFDSIRQLADVTEDVAPFVEYGKVLVPKLYDLLLLVVDNFARDEIVSTVGVMLAALFIAYVAGTWIGFWARRGRPRLIARTLQRLGARRYSKWYAANSEVALGEPVVAASRESLIRDIVDDPENTLDPAAYEVLQRHFMRK